MTHARGPESSNRSEQPVLSGLAAARPRLARCARGASAGLLACLAAVVATLVLGAFSSSPTAAADDIVLRLKSGEFEVSGTVRSADDQRWVVSAPGFGDLAIPRAQFDCVSGACAPPGALAATAPAANTIEFATAAQPTATFTIDASPQLVREAIPALITAYARHLGGSARRYVGLDGADTRFRIQDARGADVADIRVRKRGAPEVFASLRHGEATLGATTRPFTAAELATIPNPSDRTALTDYEHILALDGVAVLVPAGNRAGPIASRQLAGILSGEITDWARAGLPAGRIQVYSGPDRVSDALANLLGRPRGVTLPASANIVADEAELADAVARDPSAIGVGSANQMRSARGLDVTLSCGLVVSPTDFSVKAEEYPLTRRVHLYSDGAPKQPVAQDLVRFAASRAGQQAIREGGLIDQVPDLAPTGDEKGRVQAALRGGNRGTEASRAMTRTFATAVGGARRLSVTFRFAVGSSTLDAKSRGDVARLAEYLQTANLNGKTVMLAGFTDAAGPADLNVALSQQRAAEVREAVIKALPAMTNQPTIEAKGFGPAAPVACNGGDAGQFRNRRVEVWLRDNGTGIDEAAGAALVSLPARAPGQIKARGNKQGQAKGVAQASRRRNLR